MRHWAVPWKLGDPWFRAYLPLLREGLCDFWVTQHRAPGAQPLLSGQWIELWSGDQMPGTNQRRHLSPTLVHWLNGSNFQRLLPLPPRLLPRASHPQLPLTCSVQVSHSVVSDTLWPHGLQHTRLLCPSPTPRVYSNSCPLSQWCHPTVSSSAIPFSSHLQSFPASVSFPISQFFASGDQSIRVSASTSVLPMNIQDWFPSGWTGWISLKSKRLSRVFSDTTVQKHQFFITQLSL